MDDRVEIPHTHQAPATSQSPGTEHITGRSGEAGVFDSRVLLIPIGEHIVQVNADEWESEHTVELGPAGLVLCRRPCQTKWQVKVKQHTCYVVSTIGGAVEARLHRLLINAKRNDFVDHKNGNGLDNRMSNIRLCTALQNSHNRRGRSDTSSQFIGVRLNRSLKKWEAYVRDNRKKIHLGCFATEIAAARARDAWVKANRPEFGYLNLPEIQEATT